MTARPIQAEKFYQKLQKKFSRRINLDLSRIKSALRKIPLDPNIDISGKIVNILGEDGKISTPDASEEKSPAFLQKAAK